MSRWQFKVYISFADQMFEVIFAIKKGYGGGIMRVLYCCRYVRCAASVG
jgi:hypothetical protein